MKCKVCVKSLFLRYNGFRSRIEITESDIIQGVHLARPKIFRDPRGCFFETFRKEWFPHCSWEKIQSNHSQSKAGVLRGLHYHLRQADYWFVSKGKIRAALVDIRRSSPTRGKTQTIEMDSENPLGLFIPVGVAHGFAALTDTTLIYLVNDYFDGSDEYGIAWNDPSLKIDWGIQNPSLSLRNSQNPQLEEIDPARLPP